MRGGPINEDPINELPGWCVPLIRKVPINKISLIKGAGEGGGPITGVPGVCVWVH